MKVLKTAGVILGATAVMSLGLVMGGVGPAFGTNEKITICHASGLEGTTKFETLTIDEHAVFGPGGHFNEGGTPQAGHEQDYMGACRTDTTPTDVCPNLPGDQTEVPPGYHLGEDENGRPVCVQDETEGIPLATGATFTEATCSTPPSVHLVKTNIPGVGLRPFYNVEGPDFVDGHPVAGGTYTFTAIPVEGYVFEGQTVFVHTFAAAPTDCGTTTSPTPPRCPPGMTPTAGKDGAPGNDECEFPKTNNTPPAPPAAPPSVPAQVTTTTTTTTTTTPPAATPKPTPPRKTAAKPKPKPAPKPHTEPAKKSGHVCKPLADGTKRAWYKGGKGIKPGCYAVIEGSG